MPSEAGHGLDVAGYVRSMLREPAIMARLREETRPDYFSNMQTTPELGQLLFFLVKTLGARKILELGTYTGYSALAMALAMPAEGRLVTCDISRRWSSMAKRYWQEAGVAGIVDFRFGPALASMDGLIAQGEGGTFDFIYIDADKREYDEYYEKSLLLAKPGGVIVIDNVLLFGFVVDQNIAREIAEVKPGKAAAIEAMKSLNRKISNDPRVDQVMLPVADGLMLVRKC